MLTAPKPISQFRSTDILKRLKKKQSSSDALLKASSIWEREKKNPSILHPAYCHLKKKKKKRKKKKKKESVVAFDEPAQWYTTIQKRRSVSLYS